MKFEVVPPLSLYIHIPWCIKKCPYCDFNSHPLKTNLQEEQYIEALIEDLKSDLPKIAGREITTIFFGGGTPSLFAPASIERLLTAIQELVPFKAKKTAITKTTEPNIEITLEANPGTLEHYDLAEYLAAGITRFSLGVQSFQNDKLQALGRIHNAQDIYRAVAQLTEVGFTNFNLDLMFGLPQQRVEDALFDLQSALELQPAHLSWYQLTLEPNTAFYQQPPALPDDDESWEIQQRGLELLTKYGFEQYEVSAYARKKKPQAEYLEDYHCQHNLNYWTFGDYLGIGAGAHSKITNVEDNYVERFWKVKHPNMYLAKEIDFVAEGNRISSQQLPFEFMLNALRLTQGVSKELFVARAGLPLDVIEKTLKQAIIEGFLVDSKTKIVTTVRGKRFLNDLLQLFLK